MVVSVSRSTGRKRVRTDAMVEKLMALLIPVTGDRIRGPIIRAIHQARASTKVGDPTKAMAVLAALQLAGGPEDLRYWVHSTWLTAARSAGFPDESRLYTAGTAQMAVLVADSEAGRLRVVSSIGLGWEPGKSVSPRTLRSLAPLQLGDRAVGGSR